MVQALLQENQPKLQLTARAAGQLRDFVIAAKETNIKKAVRPYMKVLGCFTVGATGRGLVEKELG